MNCKNIEEEEVNKQRERKKSVIRNSMKNRYPWPVLGRFPRSKCSKERMTLNWNPGRGGRGKNQISLGVGRGMDILSNHTIRTLLPSGLMT